MLSISLDSRGTGGVGREGVIIIAKLLRCAPLCMSAGRPDGRTVGGASRYVYIYVYIYMYIYIYICLYRERER